VQHSFVGETIPSPVTQATIKFVTQLWQRKIYGTDGRAGGKTDILDGQMVMSGDGSEKKHMGVTVISWADSKTHIWD
jgi:hypothetical protein